MKNLILLLLILIAFNSAFAQSDPFADSVALFIKGTGSWVNQNPPYFPDNVLGPPASNASYSVPAVSPDDICSLGLGGEIILAFTNNAIVDGDGPDFTVFENAFQILYGPRAGEIFAEPGKVAVSKDGINFFEFPFDSLTLNGCAGVTPTNGSADPTNPDSSGGDSFDLATVGLDTAYFVKITDITSIILSDTSNPYYDYTANGFDLDAVAAIHSADVISGIKDIESDNIPLEFKIAVFPNPVEKSRSSSVSIEIQNKGNTKVTLYNMLGQRLLVRHLTGSISQKQILKFSAQNLSAGIYFVEAKTEKFISTAKFLIIK